MTFVLPNLAPSVVTVPTNQRIAVFSPGQFSVLTGGNGVPKNELFAGAGYYASPVFSSATIVTIAGGSNFPAFYSIGTDAIVSEYRIKVQPTPGTLNATGALTPALMFSEIITSTTAAAVTATLPTGTVMDASSTFFADEIWDWKVINTGPNTFTIAAATGHTIVGAAAVATATSARFRTRKTAANTFVTYRI